MGLGQGIGDNVSRALRSAAVVFTVGFVVHTANYVRRGYGSLTHRRRAGGAP
jgi:hypothetical protein